jgi:hypothetical protein
MANENLDQIFTANPITTNAPTDLMYFMQSPYNSGTDAGMLFSDFAAQFSAGSSSFDGDTGIATGSTITIKSGVASLLCGASIQFVASGSTVELNVTDAKSNTYFGQDAGKASSTGFNNLAFGFGSLQSITSGSDNTGIGANALSSVGTGGTNTALGYNAGTSVTTGAGNVLAGYQAGLNYTGSETKNIIIGLSNGTAAESNVTRIGFSSANASNQTKCFIDGIRGISGSGNSVVVDSNGQLFDGGAASGVSAIQIQDQAFTSVTDSGSVNALVGAYSPAITALTDGMILSITTSNTNTSNTVTFDAGTGAIPVLSSVTPQLTIAIGDIYQDRPALLQYSQAGNYWSLLNPQTVSQLNLSLCLSTTVQAGGIANVYTATNPYFGNNLTASNAMYVFVQIPDSNTSASTFTYGSTIGTLPIISQAGSALVGGEMTGGGTYILSLNSSSTGWILLNPNAAGGSSPWTSGGTNSVFGGDGSSIVTGSTDSIVWGGGSCSVLNGTASTCFGFGSVSTGFGSVAAGYFCTASAPYATAFGNDCTSSGNSTFSVGERNIVSGNNSAAMGQRAHAPNTNSYIWADGQTNPFSTSIDYSYVIACSGGFYYYNHTDTTAVLAFSVDANGQATIGNQGAGLTIKSGSNCKIGTAVLVGGTVTVSNTSVTASSLILLTAQVAGGTQGQLSIGTVVAGTSFDINSSSALDTSTIGYMIVEKG